MKRPELDALTRTIRTMGKLAPGASSAEVVMLALQWLQLEEQRAQTQALREAGATASKVLEVLLKQYARLALATHEEGAR